ncbi:DUF4116 domain-containing protein [bacterium]|jgi:hypothetical protein|nr:DUF4116 domain-containing protein [bacterium]
MNKKKLLLILGVLLMSTVFIGFTFPDWVPTKYSLNATTHQIDIKTLNVDEVINNYPKSNLRWLTRALGGATKFYRVKLINRTFTLKQYKQLIRHAYSGHKRSIVALEYTLYSDLYKSPDSPIYRKFRNILYSPEFITRVSKQSPSLIAQIPEKVSHYEELAVIAVTQNPKAFKWLTLRYKMNEKVLDAYFKSNSRYNNKVQYEAIRYANPSQRFDFVSRNGLLLETLSDKDRSNRNLVYAAVIQNEKALRFASKDIKSAINELGVLTLNKPSGIWFVLDYKFVTPLVTMGTNTVDLIEQWVVLGMDWLLKTKTLVINIILDRPDTGLEKTASKRSKLKTTKATLTKKRGMDKQIKPVVDETLIERIETITGWQLLELWQVTKLGQIGHVYVAKFKPKGSHYLGAIIYSEGKGVVMSKYPAVFSRDGNSIWRIGDKGEFGPDTFDIVQVTYTKQGVEMILKWRGDTSTNYYTLIEKNGVLEKGFIKYRPNPKK